MSDYLAPGCPLQILFSPLEATEFFIHVVCFWNVKIKQATDNPDSSCMLVKHEKRASSLRVWGLGKRDRTDGSPISELETRQRKGEGGKKRGKGDVKCDIKSGSLPRLSAACLGKEEGGVGDGRGLLTASVLRRLRC